MEDSAILWSMISCGAVADGGGIGRRWWFGGVHGGASGGASENKIGGSGAGGDCVGLCLREGADGGELVIALAREMRGGMTMAGKRGQRGACE